MKFLSLFHFLLRVSLALTVSQYTVAAYAQTAVAEEWISYRSAYKVMLQFEKYGKPKHLLQSHLQLLNGQGQAVSETQFNLQAKTFQMNLQIDPLGRIRLPLLKTAYDENAELRLAGPVQGLHLRLSLALSLPYDGHFELSQLKLACEQALNFYLSVNDKRALSKRCQAILLVYPANIKMPAPQLKNESGAITPLTAVEQASLLDQGLKGLSAYWVKFSNFHEKSQIISQQAPLAVLPHFE